MLLKGFVMRIMTVFALIFAAEFASAQTPPAGPKTIPPPPDVAAAPDDATKTASGLASKVLAPGTGKEHPSSSDVVTVDYTGWTTDGKMFDNRPRRASTFRSTNIPDRRGSSAHGDYEKRRVWIPKWLPTKVRKDGGGCWCSRSAIAFNPSP
jgi:peptidylprolyl isomerase